MSDLISRQDAIDAIRASTSKYTGFMEMEMYTDDDAVEAINGVPSADVVQVIRCKDCKHKNDCFSEVAMTNKYQTTTLYEPIEWCSKAERRES